MYLHSILCGLFISILGSLNCTLVNFFSGSCANPWTIQYGQTAYLVLEASHCRPSYAGRIQSPKKSGGWASMAISVQCR